VPLVVEANRHTYVPTHALPAGLRSTWLALALDGMERLRVELGQRRAREAAVLGTGIGLDAVGISRIFALDRVVASDVHPAVLGPARRNLARYAPEGVQVEVRWSDLLRQYPDDARFDLIYENLPNIPDRNELFRGMRTASCYDASAYRSDPASDRNLLTLHYNFLVEARERLKLAGWVVALFGGRIPYSVLVDMFARTGFRPKLLNFGVKVQTEPGLVLDGYARAEREGSPTFIYYHPIATCARVMAECGPPPGTLPVESYAEAVNARLAPHRISAAEALRVHEKGEQVCHSVYVVGATPTSPS
jgi:methylase of polypeptide subunit release factors